MCHLAAISAARRLSPIGSEEIGRPVAPAPLSSTLRRDTCVPDLAAAQMPYRLLLRNFALNVVCATSVCLYMATVARWTPMPDIAVMLSGAAFTLAWVIFGLRQIELDPYGPPAWMLAYSLSSREAVIPLGLAAGLLLSGISALGAMAHVLNERHPLIGLILTFAVLSYGMQQSGFFRYLAVRTLLLCRGSVPRLTIGFFLLTSGITYLISNVVVVLVMTPLVVELSRASGMKDIRLLLLAGCFIAANTLSMGMVFGSPSNIIVALAIDMDFLEYLRLMTAPTVIAGTASLLTVALTYAFLLIFRGERPSYRPAIASAPFTRTMYLPCALFLVALAAYSLSLGGHLPLSWVSLPMTILGLLSIYRQQVAQRGMGERGGVGDALCSLPWGIVGFALSFFLLAEAMASHFPVGMLVWLAGLPPAWQILASLGGTAALVNGLNDLPASALLGHVLADQTALSGWRETLLLQSVLVGLNVGCYLTPVGALAGLMWFHMLRRDGMRFGMIVPRLRDLAWFGGLHFFVTAAMLCGLLPAVHTLTALWLTGQPPLDLTPVAVRGALSVGAVTLVALIGALAASLWAVLRDKAGTDLQIVSPARGG